MELDPDWEYWDGGDPEVQEILAEAAGLGSGYDRLGLEYDEHRGRYKRGESNPGIRFGRGNPDYAVFRLGREKPGRREREPVVALCGCGSYFERVRPSHTYCRRGCPAIPKVKYLPDLVACRNPKCGREFVPRRATSAYCSRECSPRRPQLLPEKIACAGCGRDFKPYNSKLRYCSHGCSVKKNGGQNKLKNIGCSWCGTSFKPKRSCRVFCTRRCGAFAQHAQRSSQENS